MRGYQNILMEGKLSSSAVVAMDEMLMVDGYTCSSGIRRRTTHLSHLDIGGKFSLEDGQIVDARIDMPKSELAAVSSSVKVSLYKNLQRDWEEQRSETADEEKEENCFPESLSNALGVSVCSSHSHGVHGGVVPGAPYETQVTVSKSDNFDYYVLSFRKLGNTVEALFDTPGSSYDRRVSFQVDVRPDGAEGYIVIPGRGVEGQYENTGSFKMISLQYQKNSELQGEFELSLQITKEGINTKFAPKLFLSVKNVVDVDIDGSLLLGPDVFRAEGSIMTSLQAEAARIFAKWERGGGQHKVEAGFNLGQMFISTYATLLTSPEKTMLQATCEYGSGPGQSHSLSFTLDSSQLVDNGQKTTRGYLSMQSSQAEAYVDLDFKYQPGHAEASTNISVFNT
ncbi:putative apolipophorins-like 7, partial [Homarus americanus]